MRIKDLQGILIGNVTLKKWNEKAEGFTVIYSSTNFQVFYLSDELKEMEVMTIHADEEDQEQNFIIVEVE